MEQLAMAIRQMVDMSEDEMQQFLSRCLPRQYRRQEVLSQPGIVPDEVFFILKGLIRVTITDTEGVIHTIHFAIEYQFIADYSNFILRHPSQYTLEAVEDTQVIVLPRQAIEWGYGQTRQGDRLGRLIAEFYFIYHDHRIKNLYARTPKERYDTITQVFPNIHNRVPQHMIASYLGITPVHLSRLKKADRIRPKT